MDTVKIGIVGIGNMGSGHLSCIRNNEVNGLVATAVCDINPEKRAKAKEKYPDINCYDSYEEMLQKADIDAVLVATPHPFHCDMGAMALEAGKHILLEKPIDITVSKANMLNNLAKKGDKVFAIMFNQRTNSLYQQAKNIIESNGLGEIKRSCWIITNWYRTQCYYDSGTWRATWKGEGGGVLLNQAPHNLDLWQWICGMPESVTAFCNVAKFHNIEVEDEATIYTTYKNGATGVFITSTGDCPGTNRLEISGTKGKIVIEDGTLKHWKLKYDEREVCSTSKDGFCSIESEYREYKSESETAHKGILQNFTNAVLYGEPLLSPGTDGIKELSISNAAYLSQWKGNIPVTVPFDAEEFDRMLKVKADNSSYKPSCEEDLSADRSKRWQVRW